MDNKDIKHVLNIMDYLKKTWKELSWMDSQYRSDKMEKIIKELNALVDECEGNLEISKIVLNELMPEVNKLDAAINEIHNILENYSSIDILENKKMLLEGSCENCFVHLSADTTANVGDYILVRSLKTLIERKVNKDISWCNIDVRKTVNQDIINACNRSNRVIIGGGGLFLKDTNQNDISGWQWPCSIENMERINTPIYVLGVGYNRFRGQEDFDECFTESINRLVEKSAFFGLRNHGSIRAIREYLREDLKDKVMYHPCATTVLSKLYELPEKAKNDTPFIALNCAYDRANLRYGDKQDDVMLKIARVCKKLSCNYKIKCYIHCMMDQTICKYLDYENVGYEIVDMTKEMSREEYLRYFVEPELVLAMRGHAQMIPFGCLTPTVSMISHDKLAWFLEDIGHSEWGVEVLDNEFETKIYDISEYMLNNRTEIIKQIAESQDVLWEILQDNLRKARLA